MSKIATSRSCSMLGLPRPMEASSRLMATSRALEFGSTGGSNMRRFRILRTVSPFRLVGMSRPGLGLPCGAQVAQLRLDALHMKPDRAAVREPQHHVPCRRFAGLELDRQQLRDRTFVLQVKPLHLSAEHSLEAQRR